MENATKNAGAIVALTEVLVLERVVREERDAGVRHHAQHRRAVAPEAKDKLSF